MSTQEISSQQIALFPLPPQLQHGKNVLAQVQFGGWTWSVRGRKHAGGRYAVEIFRPRGLYERYEAVHRISTAAYTMYDNYITRGIAEDRQHFFFFQIIVSKKRRAVTVSFFKSNLYPIDRFPQIDSLVSFFEKEAKREEEQRALLLRIKERAEEAFFL